MAKKSGKIVGPGSGTAATTPANVPGTPTFVSHGTGTITISFSINNNDSSVTYAIYCNELSKFVGADKVVDEAPPGVWQTFTAWGTLALSGFSDYTSYTFKVKAKDEATVETAYSSDSVGLCTDPGVDYGPTSENLSREVTGGNTIVDSDYGLVISGTEVAAAEATQSTLPEYYGDITVTYKLKNNSSTTSRILVQFSEDGSSWATATKGTGGDAITALTTSAAGTSHTFVWDSYTDAGTSELDTSVYLRITPYDASPSGGDAASAVSSAAFAVNNRPAIIAWTNADGFTFDKDTTPVFMATMPLLRGGTVGFPALHVYESDGNTLVMDRLSLDSVVGWEYETALNTWTGVTFAGIPTAKINGTLRCRYTVQAADALTANTTYIINGEMGENRDES